MRNDSEGCNGLREKIEQVKLSGYAEESDYAEFAGWEV
jgi:hypothetical protein